MLSTCISLVSFIFLKNIIPLLSSSIVVLITKKIQDILQLSAATTTQTHTQLFRASAANSTSPNRLVFP